MWGHCQESSFNQLSEVSRPYNTILPTCHNPWAHSCKLEESAELDWIRNWQLIFYLFIIIKGATIWNQRSEVWIITWFSIFLTSLIKYLAFLTADLIGAKSRNTGRAPSFITICPEICTDGTILHLRRKVKTGLASFIAFASDQDKGCESPSWVSSSRKYNCRCELDFYLPGSSIEHLQRHIKFFIWDSLASRYLFCHSYLFIGKIKCLVP